MTNTSRKGAEIEKRAQDLLVGQGYLVHRTIRTPFINTGKMRFGSNANDVFNVFDLIALGQGACRFIQVTVIDEVLKRQRKVLPVAARFPASMCWGPVGSGGVPLLDVLSAEVWGWIGGRELGADGSRGQYFRIWVWDGNECAWVERTRTKAQDDALQVAKPTEE